eukprot:1908582-Amphidinium_carterae.1
MANNQRRSCALSPNQPRLEWPCLWQPTSTRIRDNNLLPPAHARAALARTYAVRAHARACAHTHTHTLIRARTHARTHARRCVHDQAGSTVASCDERIGCS